MFCKDQSNSVSGRESDRDGEEDNTPVHTETRTRREHTGERALIESTYTSGIFYELIIINDVPLFEYKFHIIHLIKRMSPPKPGDDPGVPRCLGSSQRDQTKRPRQRCARRRVLCYYDVSKKILKDGFRRPWSYARLCKNIQFEEKLLFKARRG